MAPGGIAIAGAAVALIASMPVLAHHAFSAEFDANKPFKMSGTVTKVEWMNPHTFFYIDVTDEKTKKVTNWAMEMGSPNGLIPNPPDGEFGGSRTGLDARCPGRFLLHRTAILRDRCDVADFERQVRPEGEGFRTVMLTRVLGKMVALVLAPTID